MKKKTIKTPLMMSEALGPTCWSSILVLENKFSHGTQSHHGLVPKLRHHGGKNSRPTGSKTRNVLLAQETAILHSPITKYRSPIVVFQRNGVERCFCFLKVLMSKGHVLLLAGRWWKLASNQIHDKRRTKAQSAKLSKRVFMVFCLNFRAFRDFCATKT